MSIRFSICATRCARLRVNRFKDPYAVALRKWLLSQAVIIRSQFLWDDPSCARDPSLATESELLAHVIFLGWTVGDARRWNPVPPGSNSIAVPISPNTNTRSEPDHDYHQGYLRSTAATTR